MRMSPAGTASKLGHGCIRFASLFPSRSATKVIAIQLPSTPFRQQTAVVSECFQSPSKAHSRATCIRWSSSNIYNMETPVSSLGNSSQINIIVSQNLNQNLNHFHLQKSCHLGGWFSGINHSRRMTASLMSFHSHPLDQERKRISGQQQPSLYQIRWYTPMSDEEKQTEKERLESLSTSEREEELRKLNREIARLEQLRLLNTGEGETWAGKYKILVRDYGVPFMVYYYGVWMWMLIGSYLVVEWGNVDVMALLFKIDQWTGYDISSHVRPEYGKIGLALVLNEVLEVVRLPFVIASVKPVMDRLFPTKY